MKLLEPTLADEIHAAIFTPTPRASCEHASHDYVDPPTHPERPVSERAVVDGVPVQARDVPPHQTHSTAAREREYLMPLYGAYHGRKLDDLVAAPFVEAGWLTRGGRRDWLTDAGREALRKARFDL